MEKLSQKTEIDPSDTFAESFVGHRDCRREGDYMQLTQRQFCALRRSGQGHHGVTSSQNGAQNCLEGDLKFGRNYGKSKLFKKIILIIITQSDDEDFLYSTIYTDQIIKRIL